jgi:solute carrier family 25 citrate transporter 1
VKIIAALTCFVPGWTALCCRQAANKGGPQYTGFMHCLKSIASNEGMLALWKGLVPRLARTPPGQAIVWSVSDQITGYFERQRRAQVA